MINFNMDDHVIIRNYHPGDEATVENITYRTGLYGENLSEAGFFNDRRLFFMIFMYYYTRYEPQHFFVAFDKGKQEVVGFIGGTTDTIHQEREFQAKVLPRILIRAILFTSWRYPSTFCNLIKMRAIEGVVDVHRMQQVAQQYPAHLHINLLPGSQRLGIGGRLIQHFEDHLRSHGVLGLHLTTTSYHHKAIPFYEKNGYQLAYETGVAPHPLYEDFRLLTFTKRLVSGQ